MTRQTFGSPVFSLAWQNRPNLDWMPMEEDDGAAAEVLSGVEDEKLLVTCAAK